jgi:phage repressor protein C with HTH and peptisase S24 domain
MAKTFIKEWRKYRGLTQEQLADMIDMSNSNLSRIESGSVRYTSDSLEMIAHALAVNVADLLSRSPSETLTSPDATHSLSFGRNNAQKSTQTGPTIPTPSKMPKDVPVYGTAQGGPVGAFQMENGVIDYVRRPPGIADAKDVYALYIVGDSMAPRYQEGELVYVSSKRPVRPGDYVIVEFVNGDGEQVAYCKQLMRRNASTLQLTQSNPERVFDLEMDRVLRVHRILTMNELMGV